MGGFAPAARSTQNKGGSISHIAWLIWMWQNVRTCYTFYFFFKVITGKKWIFRNYFFIGQVGFFIMLFFLWFFFFWTEMNVLVMLVWQLRSGCPRVWIVLKSHEKPVRSMKNDFSHKCHGKSRFHTTGSWKVMNDRYFQKNHSN